jgi:hypothetical protein
MKHQPGKYYILVEVEKFSTESVFYFLKSFSNAVFHEPNNEIINKYIPEDKDSVIVKSLVSEAPTQIMNGIKTVTIEKLLVDIFCDEIIFSAQQGAEMRNIFIEALDKYTVNENRMMRYTDRRRKKEKFIKYLETITKFRQHN